MLVIRLARTGRKNYATYRIVAADSRRPATGKFVAILGNYNPHTKELSLKPDEVKTFIDNGAQPSDAVIRLLQKEKVKLPDWVTLTTKSKAPKKEPVEKVPAAGAPAVAETTETEAPTDTGEATAAEVTEAKADDDSERVAEEATDTVAETEEAAVKSTDEDSDHTDTAATESEQTDAATEADAIAAEAAAPAAE